MAKYRPRGYFSVFRCDAAGNLIGGVVSTCNHKHRHTYSANACRERLEKDLGLAGELTVRQVVALEAIRKQKRRRRKKK